ncbi:hypothetical protein HYH02_002346 [Chlamydomonas schloesseri]|uniref:Guanylate cyclase domain-containing protein n=1 Tax=Chlamydomonas schloesseri TaxID=2026947 RepID=A0A835WSQ7_9CHLO|nr:hypothetical protein HYH02_002346 [Chlamydomonas schloesseri]|eukprot:KAG2453010.1 hypothetical protein HYH02_002346 [Chlamydomonas schloesseri]
MLYVLRERSTLLLGPYNCRAGFKCAFIVTPLFLPAPGADYDWGCGLQPYNCSDLCWDPVNRTKFHSQVSTMINLDPLLTGSDARLHMLASRGYLYKLWQANTSGSNPYFLLSNTTRLPADPVTLSISLYNVQWYLEIAPVDGWVPAWRGPCIAAVVVGSAAVSLLVLWLLVSKEQHNRLLKAMLPGKVIKQLQAGETAIAQEYSAVTVLFSDIVGYTTVAAQLSPCQVVVLLNELFSIFDDLTLRNGVYKVETIGDALMCVAGCPVPDDPVNSAVRAANMALDMVRAVEAFRPSLEGVRVQIRVGLHSGPVVSDATAALLRASGQDFSLEPRGTIDVKGKGNECANVRATGHMETFFLAAGASPLPRGKSFLQAVQQRPAALVVQPAAQQQQQQQQQPTRSQAVLGASGGSSNGNGNGPNYSRPSSPTRRGATWAVGRRSGERPGLDGSSAGKDSGSLHASGGKGASRALTVVLDAGGGGAGAGSRSPTRAGGEWQPHKSDVAPSSFEVRLGMQPYHVSALVPPPPAGGGGGGGGSGGRCGGGVTADTWLSSGAAAPGGLSDSSTPSPLLRTVPHAGPEASPAADRSKQLEPGAGGGTAAAVAESGATPQAPPSVAEGQPEEAGGAGALEAVSAAATGTSAAATGGTPIAPAKLHRLAMRTEHDPGPAPGSMNAREHERTPDSGTMGAGGGGGDDGGIVDGADRPPADSQVRQGLSSEPLPSSELMGPLPLGEPPQEAKTRSGSMRQALRGLFRNLTSGRGSETGSGSGGSTPHAADWGPGAGAAASQLPGSRQRASALSLSNSRAHACTAAMHSAAATTEPGQAAAGTPMPHDRGPITSASVFQLGTRERSRGGSGAFRVLTLASPPATVGARTPTTRPGTETGLVSATVAVAAQQQQQQQQQL